MEDRHSATRTISAVMAITLLGKVMGLYRDHLLAVHYGMGMEANAFYTASRIPRVFFDAVFASAIAACFIPVFSEYLEQKGKKEAYRFAGCFITIIALLTGVLTLAGMAFPQPLVALFADYEDPQTTALAISLTRTMFPTVLFSGVAFSLVGVLQAQDHFTAPALMSALSNLVIIAYFLFLDQSMGIYGLALAYLLGWFLQGVIQVPPLRRLGYQYRPGLVSGDEKGVCADGAGDGVHLGPAHQSGHQFPIRFPAIRGGGCVRYGVFHQPVSGYCRYLYPVDHQCDFP